MPTFSYKAISAAGQTITGTLDAPDRKGVVRKLKADKCTPVEIKNASGAPADIKAAPRPIEFDAPKEPKARATSRLKKTSGDTVALAFLGKLLQLHKSGMPVGDAVKTLNQRLTEPHMREISNGLWREISEGRTLAAAMRQFPNTFDANLTYLIEAGEATGNVTPVLENVIAHLEERSQMKRKILAGLAYPALICTLVMTIIVGFLFYFVPQVQKMMETMGGEMSLPAKILIAIADGMLTYGPFFLIGLVFAFFIFKQWRNTDKGRLATDRAALRLPVLKGVVQNIELGRTANLLGTLLGNGVNATESLRLTAKAIQNQELLARFQAARHLINDGAAFSLAFKKTGFFPDSDIDILGIAENTGTPVSSLHDIARNRTEELTRQFKHLTIGISTGALLLAVGMVGLLVTSIVLTMLDLTQSIGAG